MRERYEEEVKVIANSLCISARQIKGGARSKKVAVARQICSYLLKERYPDIVLQKIANLIGIRDHTTIIYHLQRVRDMLDTDDEEYKVKLQIAQYAIRKWENKQSLG